MKRLDALIREARERSGNARYGVNQGIPQRSFVSYANDAQQRIYNKILGERSSLYVREAFINVQAGVAIYDLPEDIHLKHNIVKVDYSQTGDARLYSKLELRSPSQEVSSPGYPSSYFLRNGQIIVSPIPQTAATRGIRINYQYTIPSVDIRRARISALALTAPAATAWPGVSASIQSQVDIATNGTGFMSVGNSGTALYSATGASFSATGSTGFAASGVNAVAWGNGRWVIGGQSANVAVSFNNSTWELQSGAFAPGETVYDIAYGNGTFVVVGTQAILYTGVGDTALTWTGRTSGFSSSFIAGVCFNPDNGKFVIVGQQGKVASSDDSGATWTLLTTNIPAALTLQKIVYANGVYLTIDSGGRLFRSADAVTWTEIFAGQNTSYTTLSVANDVFFIGGSISATTTYASFNGVDWVAQNVQNVLAVAGTSSLLAAVVGSAATLIFTTVPNTVIGISLNPTSITDESEEDLASWTDYVSIVNKQGVQLHTGIEVLSYDTEDSAISVTPATIVAPANEMYVTFGADSTTNSELLDIAERYLVEYMVLRAQMRSSSGEAADTSPVLNEIEKEILDSIAELEEDLTAIPLLDFSMLDYADDL